MNTAVGIFAVVAIIYGFIGSLKNPHALGIGACGAVLLVLAWKGAFTL